MRWGVDPSLDILARTYAACARAIVKDVKQRTAGSPLIFRPHVYSGSKLHAD
jgi:hypothetical protein